MDLQPLDLFNLDFYTSQLSTFLTIYDSESFGSTVGFCMLPIVHLDTPLIKLS